MGLAKKTTAIVEGKEENGKIRHFYFFCRGLKEC